MPAAALRHRALAGYTAGRASPAPQLSLRSGAIFGARYSLPRVTFNSARVIDWLMASYPTSRSRFCQQRADGPLPFAARRRRRVKLKNTG